MVIAPSGVADYGGQSYHLVTGTIDGDESGCREGCFFSTRLLEEAITSISAIRPSLIVNATTANGFSRGLRQLFKDRAGS